PVGDDMAYIMSLKKSNVLDFTIYEGMISDSRWMTPIAFFRNVLMKYLPHSLSLTLYTILFFINTYIIFFHFLRIKLSSNAERIILYSFFTLIVFYGLNKITSEVIFWQAG